MRVLLWLLLLAPLSLAGDLPDLQSEAQRGRCDHKPVAGADSTYVGELSWTEEGQVTGYERRLLFANSRWRANRGEDGKYGRDCTIHWTVQGRKVPTTSCAQCEFGISFQADIDYDASSCPMQLQLEGNHFKGAYDIDLREDGTLEVFFANSGKKLGRGAHEGQTLRWISDHRCMWL